MTSSLGFLQQHCVILKLVLFHGSKSAANEMLWSHHITSELGKLCKVLYARPTFSKAYNTLVRQDTGLDLVLSCYDVGLLSPVLFSIKGITMGRKAERAAVSGVCPPIGEYFTLEPSNVRLESLRARLTRQWSKRKHAPSVDRNGQPAVIQIGHWIFDSQPVRSVVTSENNLVALNSRNLRSQYDLRDHRGSRFFAEGSPTNVNQKSLVTKANEQTTGNYLRIKPVLYEGFDPMPGSLKRWLHDVVAEGVEPDARDQERLDLLLHGFKGFG
ncbi:hypothetical protein HG536_0C02270 [Torulaspora globosa]|uniref:Uncharacterized protein n=1 Tax=Torulaspora globosa TaxID=48254 RepID=A0A7G3ZEX2_9SACH|nr:uncharacterized protein HG536_0C02270 [Torulaspora globosa]QLL32058.1 hypothetical protein HG536_0C02270 [Torulaspora globosa]